MRSQGPLSVAAVLRFGREICSALAAASETGLVHRNINPSCILFGEDDGAKLGDFTLLRDLGEEESFDASASPSPLMDYMYRAPEQLTGAQSLDATCDVYSLAVCMVEALAGGPAFGGTEDGPAMLVAAATQLPPPLRKRNPRVGVELERVLFQALAKDPKRRFPSAEEFARALTQAEAGSDLNHRPSVRQERESNGRRPAAPMLASVLA
jgi:serine/threonine-protein kinase